MTGRTDDEALLKLAPLLEYDMGRRLRALVEVGSDPQRVIAAEERAQRAEDLAAEIRRQMDGMRRQIDRAETASQFVVTEEPYHDNSEIIGVGRSWEHARALIRAHRITRRLRNDVPSYASWTEGCFTNTAEQRPCRYVEHDGTAYQVMEIRNV